MMITKCKPCGNMMDMQQQLNRMFWDYLHNDGSREETESFPTWYPITDIYETDNDYVFKLEIPGLTKEDVSIELNGQLLSIKGEKKAEKDKEKENLHRIESYTGSFCRRFELPKNIDAQKVNAAMKDGILSVRITKMEEAKPKNISIS